MNQKQFSKYSFRHSEILVYHSKHPCEDIEMMLVAVDFDLGLMKLAPINIDYYVDEAKWIPFDRVDKPIKKMKIITNKK